MVRNCLFQGFVISSIIGILVIIIYNCTIIHEVSNISFWWLILPFPVPLFLLLLIDVFGVIFCISALKQSIDNSFIIAAFIITIFVQMMSYHSGWIILLLITYPLQVGTLILTLVIDYIAISFSFALAVLYFKKWHNRKLPAKILCIGGYFFVTLAYFLIVYNVTLAKYPHEDSITKFIPSFLPFLFIGICSWIGQNIIFKVINYDNENEVSHSIENPMNSNIVNAHDRSLPLNSNA